MDGVKFQNSCHLGCTGEASGPLFAEAKGVLKLAVALVVEDEWLVRMEIADVLDAHGWTVLEASTAEAALAMRDHNPPVDLVVTDIRLPGPLTGWDVADAFRAANADVGVIYCSGNPCEVERQVPDSVFLSKPCRMDYLIEASTRLCLPANEKRAD